MIKIKKIEKNYMTCHSCNSKDSLVNIIIGFDEYQTSTFRLCKKCRIELIEKLK